MARSVWKNIAGTWKIINNVHVKVAGTWLPDAVSWIKEYGIWEQCGGVPSFWEFLKNGLTAGHTIPEPWIQAGTASMNWTTGYFDIGSISSPYSFININVSVELFGPYLSRIGFNTIYNAGYTASDNIIGSVYLDMTDIPVNGYKVVCTIDEVNQ